MSDESVILINLLKVKPEKRDALIALLAGCTDRALEAEPRHGDLARCPGEDDPADRGEGCGDCKPRRFTSRRASPRKLRGRDPLTDKLCGNGTIADVRRFWLAFGKRTPLTRQREGRSQSPSTASRRNCGALAAALRGEWRTSAHSRPEYYSSPALSPTWISFPYPAFRCRRRLLKGRGRRAYRCPMVRRSEIPISAPTINRFAKRADGMQRASCPTPTPPCSMPDASPANGISRIRHGFSRR